MYNTIMVAVDMSSANEHALRTARRLGTPDETEIMLLHVIETLHEEEPGEMDDFYAELQEEADEKLEAWAKELAEEGFDVHATITYGERGPEITRVAAEKEVDLIVLRSHQVDRDDPEGSLGTVSHQVAVFAPCSVLLVRTDETQ